MSNYVAISAEEAGDRLAIRELVGAHAPFDHCHDLPRCEPNLPGCRFARPVAVS